MRECVRAAERTAFRRLCTLAIEEQVDALILAGDLFDGPTVRLPTRIWIADELRQVCDAGITVVVATGNHDPGDRLTRLGIDWPSERFVLAASDAPVTVVLDAGTIVAIGHPVERESRNLAALLPNAPTNTPSVAVLHAQVMGAIGERERYAPCTIDDLRAKGYGYTALGHVHERQSMSDDPHAWYSGCLQAHDIGEPGAKGALVVSVETDGRAEVRFQSLAPLRFERVELRDLDCEPGQLAERIAGAVRDLPAGAPDEEFVVRVVLSGRSQLAGQLSCEMLDGLHDELAAHLGALAVELRVDDLYPVLDLDEFRDKPHVLGTALALLVRARTDHELRATITPSALAGGEGDDYLLSLLDGLEPALAEALLA